MLMPDVLSSRPGALLSLLGGLVAALLDNALLFALPAFGLPFIDAPHLVGGLFTAAPTPAFWIGFWIEFVIGTAVLPLVLWTAWPRLPGAAVGLLGAAVKGIIWGLVLWVLAGLLLPLAGAMNHIAPSIVPRPGFFAASLGLSGAVVLLAAHVAYGLALTLVAAMGQGIAGLDTLGWPGHAKASTPPGDLFEAAQGLPEYPFVGSR